MIPPAPSCDYACFASGMAETVADVFGTYFHVSFVIFGGLVVWAGFLIARFILNGCSFRGRGRRR